MAASRFMLIVVCVASASWWSPFVPVAERVPDWCARGLSSSVPTAGPAPVAVQCNAAAAWLRVVAANATAQRAALVEERRRHWARWSALRREDRVWRSMLPPGGAAVEWACACGHFGDLASGRIANISRCQTALRARVRAIDGLLAGLHTVPVAQGLHTVPVSVAIAEWEAQVRCQQTERWLAARGSGHPVARGPPPPPCSAAFVEAAVRWWAPRVDGDVQRLSAVADAARVAVDGIGCGALAWAAATIVVVP